MFIDGVYIMNKEEHLKARGWKDKAGGIHYPEAPKAVTGPDGKPTGVAFNPYFLSNKDLAKNYDVDVWRDAYKAAGRDMDKIDKMAEKYGKIEKYEEEISKLKDKINNTDDKKKIAKYEKQIAKIQEKINKLNKKIDKIDGGESEKQEAEKSGDLPVFDK